MKTKMLFGGLFAFILMTTVFYPQEAYACSCMADEFFEDSYANADAVFVGTVTSFENELGNGAETRDVRFDVTKVFKGSADAQQTLETPNNSAACGYEFTEDESYLVFANRWGEETVGPLTVSLCSRTELESDADTEIAVLEDITTPIIPTEHVDSGVIRALMERLIQLLRELLAQYGR